MSEERTEQTRVRLAYKVSAKGVFQPDVTSEAETVATAMVNMRDGLAQMKALAKEEGTDGE